MDYLFRVIVDHGSYRNIYLSHSEWAAKFICNDLKHKLKNSGDKDTKVYVERIKPSKAV